MGFQNFNSPNSTDQPSDHNLNLKIQELQQVIEYAKRNGLDNKTIYAQLENTINSLKHEQKRVIESQQSNTQAQILQNLHKPFLTEFVNNSVDTRKFKKQNFGSNRAFINQVFGSEVSPEDRIKRLKACQVDGIKIPLVNSSSENLFKYAHEKGIIVSPSYEKDVNDGSEPNRLIITSDGSIIRVDISNGIITMFENEYSKREQ